MLLAEFTAVASVQSRADLLAELTAFARRLGFEKVNATAVEDRGSAESEFAWVNNASESYRSVSETVEVGRRDPVGQHCKRSSVPIIWNRETYLTAGEVEKWEVQAQHGYATGIALATHLQRGCHFYIGVDRDQALPADPAEVTRMAAALQLFAAHAQDPALRVLLPSVRALDDIPDLTQRELEALRWTMDGKTAWELGRILGISEQTAARHVNNATRKLGCVNKLQAVLRAVRLGLIY